jgi:hypothetical protein
LCFGFDVVVLCAGAARFLGGPFVLCFVLCGLHDDFPFAAADVFDDASA